MRSDVEIITAQLMVSLLLGLLGGFVGTYFYLDLTGQISLLKEKKRKPIFKLYFLFFSAIFGIIFFALRFFD